MNTYLGWTWWVSSLGLIPLLLGSHGLVALLYQRGAFGPEQSVQVGFIQAMYFLQIPFYLAGILLVRLISALGKNQILLLGTLLSAGLNFGLDLGLLRIMGLPGIALSTSIVYGVSFFFLWGWAKHLMRRAEANQ